MHIDVKVTLWKIIELPETVTKEEAIEILKRDGSINEFFDNADKYGFLNYDEIENTEEDMTIEENGGQATIELREDGEVLWSNLPEIPEFRHSEIQTAFECCDIKTCRFIFEGKYSESPESWAISLRDEDDEEIELFIYDYRPDYEYDLNLLNSFS